MFGNINGKTVVMMQGRCHLYEGHTAGKVCQSIMVIMIIMTDDNDLVAMVITGW